MKMNLLVILGDKKNSDIDSIKCQAHHIIELFMELLPKYLDIDGSSRITINFKPKGARAQYSTILGTSNYFIEENKLNEYNCLDVEEKEGFILKLIEESLIDIAKRNSRGQEIEDIIRKTYELVIKNNFSLKIKVSKISRKSSCGKFKANVYRYLNKELGEAWCVEIVSKDSKESYVEWITEKPSYLNRKDFFKKSIWQGEEFLIYNRLDKLVRTIKPKFKLEV
ncbi:hypothetical protein E4V42_09360 [Clostridium estertheticum]|uniref:Uncharacterized protein n=1 Tax=Clostridium estertheticum TaxID=238834 RepID=A0A5N7J897_9CLOT|nr:hypothetical protein [Clostridium estertheticum]MPQ31646.1 hypothetical protein [Clostridium estertheticum]MPQ64964.1 hypothetical protein [Clostridium estertheticum]